MKTVHILLLSLLLTTTAWAGQAVEQTRPASSRAAVSIENLAGSVAVHGWNRDEVKVTGTLGDDVEGLEVSGEPDKISIEVKIPRGRHDKGNDFASDLDVWVPAACRLEVETVSASIGAEDLSGTLELESVSGGITVTGQPEAVDIESVSGAVEVSGARTRASVETVSGDVRLTGVAANVEVETVNGEVRVTAEEIERGSFEAVSGSLILDTRLAPGARLDIEGHSAEVELTLPAGTSASFSISTFSGEVDNQMGPPAKPTSQYTPGKHLEFATGSGDAKVQIETFSGNVKLLQK